MFDIQKYLDLPENPSDCIYENYRNKILLNPEIFTRILKHNHKEEMKNIHTLHICLYDKYGEDWVNNISFTDEMFRDAIKMLYIEDYPGKDVIISKQNQRKELYKQCTEDNSMIACEEKSCDGEQSQK